MTGAQFFEFLEVLDNSPSEVIERYPLFLLGLFIIIALIAAEIITRGNIAGALYIGVVAVLLMAYGVRYPRPREGKEK